MIGLKDEAIKSNALLDYNFPKSEWTKISKSLLKNEPELNQQKDNKYSIINYFKDFF